MFSILPLISFALLYACFCKKAGTLPGSRRESFLYASLVWGGLVAASTETLSLFHEIHFGFIVGFWGAFTAALLITYFKMPASSAPLLPFKAFAPLTALEKALAGVVFFVLAMTAMVAFIAPPNSWDALVYHMSRVAFWAQNHTVDPYPTGDYRQTSFPPWPGYAMLHFQVLAGSDRFANLVTWFSFAGSVLIASWITLQLGGNRLSQWLAAFFAATIPVCIVESSGVRGDLIGTYWFLCLAALAVRQAFQASAVSVIWIGLSLGLGVLTKTVNYFYAFPFAAGYACLVIKKFGWRAAFIRCAAVGALALALNAGFMGRNIVIFQHPFSTSIVAEALATSDMDLRLLILNSIHGLGFHMGNALPAWNDGVLRVIESLHSAWGVSMDDPRITSTHAVFTVGVSTHEDGVGNFCQVSLILFCFFALVRSWRSQRQLVVYALVVLAGFILHNYFIKWTNHSARQQLPFFVGLAPIVALAIAQWHARKKIVVWLIVIALTAPAMPYVFRNNLRRIISSKQTIFNTPRREMYFRNDSNLYAPFDKAVVSAAEGGCDQVGFDFSFNTWDYPFWAARHYRGLSRVRFEHLNSWSPNLIQYPLGPFTPCAVISIHNHSDAAQFAGNRKFRKIWTKQTESMYISKLSVFKIEP